MTRTGRPFFGLALCLGVLLIPALARADVGGLMRAGNRQFGQKKHDEALATYQQAEVLEPDATAIHYNIGNTLHRLGRYQEAVSELELVMTDKNTGRRANAMYNIGNTLYKAGQLDPAIQSYIAALVMKPGDKQAKENLEFCLKKKAEQQQQPDSSQQNQQQQNQQQQQQQQQQQPRPQQMDKDQAQRVVEAVENKEKEEQKEQQQSRPKRKVEKDW